MKKIQTTFSYSPEQTLKLAQKFAQTLKPGTLILLKGSLGSGKTTFVKGLAKGLKISKEALIHSPTFSLIHEYPGPLPLFHVDLYRIAHEKEVDELGLDEYLERGGILAIEWPERVSSNWPSNAIGVEFALLSSGVRQITFRAN